MLEYEVARRCYSFADYLEVEELSPNVKHEFVDGEILAMAGGTVEHAALATGMGTLLGAQLRGTACRPYSSDLRIRIESANVGTYADLAIICDPVQRDPVSPTHVTNPRVIIEVLSASTEAYDRGEKREAYQSLPSLSEYVLVAQDRRRIEVWRRTAEGWDHSVHGPGASVVLTSIAATVVVDELYAVAGVHVE
jgi:Uma2 family endonuclease